MPNLTIRANPVDLTKAAPRDAMDWMRRIAAIGAATYMNFAGSRFRR